MVNGGVTNVSKGVVSGGVTNVREGVVIGGVTNVREGVVTLDGVYVIKELKIKSVSPETISIDPST